MIPTCHLIKKNTQAATVDIFLCHPALCKVHFLSLPTVGEDKSWKVSL